MSPGKLAITPPDATCQFEVSAPFELLVLALPSDLIRRVHDEALGGTAIDLTPVHRRDLPDDPALASIMKQLWAEAADGNPMGSLYVEDAAIAVAARLARIAMQSHGISVQTRLDPPLHGPRLVRVLSRIEDDLGGDLDQASLANLAGLSTWHFCRAFKSATGVPPHRFVLLRRLARAQWMLRFSKLTLAEIASACGFASHAHLSAAFRQQTGTTPSQWRATHQAR